MKVLTATQLLHFFFYRIRRISDHLFTTRTSQAARYARFEIGKCPLLPGGLGQLVCQGLGLDLHQPYLLLWACYCVRDGASHLDTMQVLGALGFVPTFRWSDPGRGREIFNPVSI